MKITLDYGRTGLDVTLPDDRLVGPLAIRPAAPLADPAAAIEQAAMESRGTLEPDSELGKWVAWMRGYADRLDPLFKLRGGKKSD